MERKILLFVSISLTLLIAVVSLIPINQQFASPVNNLDKIVHALMYFLLTLSWLKTVDVIKKYQSYFYQLLLIHVVWHNY